MRSQTNSNHSVGVVIAGNNTVNSLGVVRNLGEQGMPIILLSSNSQDMVRHSKYISKKLASPKLKESEIQFVDFLLNQGKQMDGKHVLIPKDDEELLTFSRYKEELDQYYFIPIACFEIVQKLTNKKIFYQLLDQMSIPHPRTYFPEDISELKSMGREIEYPYIIKPAYMHLFMDAFHTKNFLIKSSQELNHAIKRLENKKLDVMIQEIIPGNEIYMFYTYFNRQSEPLAVCGYDKLRQCPPDFGSGSLCRSMWRAEPIDSAIQMLRTIKYHGMAEPEFKKDPRDGQYKLLEINARTTLESRLPAKCGVNIEYIAYLDTIGQYRCDSVFPKSGILWMDEIADLRSCFKQIRRKTLSVKELAKSLRGKKVYAVADWSDPLPFFIHMFYFTGYALKHLFAVRRRNGHHQ